MTREHQTDAALDALLAEAGSDMPDDALMARVLADAAAVQTQTQVVTPAPRVARRGNWLTAMVDMVGGWGALGGVTAAGVTGLAVGLYAPHTVGVWIGSDTLGQEASLSYDLSPDISALWLEDDDV